MILRMATPAVACSGAEQQAKGAIYTMPTVDIITPAYNAARFLPVAIDSVIAQTFQDWRILLIDDGSTDDTEAVVAPYLDRLGPKLLYIKQPNAGLPAARNAAIRASTAEFLALLDADDIWLPSRLEESLKSFQSDPEIGMSYGFVSRVDQNGTVIDTFTNAQKHGQGWIAPYIYMRMVDLPCPTIMFRRQCIDQVGFFDETLRATEDRDLWLRLALKYKVALAPHLIAHYRVSAASMTTDPYRMLSAQLRFIEKHYGSPGCGWMARRVALARIYKQLAEALEARRQRWGALKSAMRALLLNPLDARNARTAASLLLRLPGRARRSRPATT